MGDPTGNVQRACYNGAVDLPSRVHGLDAARARYGPATDRILSRLYDSDDLADAAVASLEGLERGQAEALLARGLTHGPDAVRDGPEALRALLDATWTVPAWVDGPTCDRAGRLLFRSGFVGGMVLGTKSLVLGYASPGGNKPLVLSGRLMRPEYVGKRLAETARFVMAISEPGGLEPGADGHQITTRVRLMHARVRRLALASGVWDAAAWGHPINQHDMLATIFVFSAAFLEGVTQLGLEVSPAEAEDYTQLWNRVGAVIGVDPALLPGSPQEALRNAELIGDTQGEPDDDARRLVRGYFEGPLAAARTKKERRAAKARVALSRALARYLLGPERSLALGLGTDRGLAPRAVQALVAASERARLHSPRLDAEAARLGHAHWARAVRLGLAGGAADFALPTTLAGVRPFLASAA